MQETRKAREFLLASYIMLGFCFAHKQGFHMVDLAIKQLKKGLETRGCRDEGLPRRGVAADTMK